jgi:hypothetical protein
VVHKGAGFFVLFALCVSQKETGDRGVSSRSCVLLEQMRVLHVVEPAGQGAEGCGRLCSVQGRLVQGILPSRPHGEFLFVAEGGKVCFLTLVVQSWRCCIATRRRRRR